LYGISLQHYQIYSSSLFSVALGNKQHPDNKMVIRINCNFAFVIKRDNGVYKVVDKNLKQLYFWLFSLMVIARKNLKKDLSN